MFGFSMIQMVRNNAHKLDKQLREEFTSIYRPFKYTPCFLHRTFERFLSNFKQYSVIISFQQCKNKELQQEYQTVNEVLHRHLRCQIGKQFPSIQSCSATVTAVALEEILSKCAKIKKVYYNREVKALLDVATPTINATNIVRNHTELTGEGITIAVIDTGVHPHPDLQGRIKGFRDFINNEANPYDDNGHGTHCAGDAAGNGSMSGGQYKGPAPNASIVGVKVLNKLGSGSLATVMEGVQWCIENKDALGINILSLSLGSTASSAYRNENDDPMVQIVEAAWDAGLVVCVAAGNEGPDPHTIASPGVSSKVITVGAMDDKNTPSRSDDEIASFSSRGPTIYGVKKPDVVAPGVNIISLRSPGSYIDKLQKNARVGEHYISLSGTSMATPICAGVVALLLQHNPNLTPYKVKKALMKNAIRWGDNDEYVYGAGYIDAERTIT
ncbi:S8 family peptidase [Sutcliffiella cohnii]